MQIDVSKKYVDLKKFYLLYCILVLKLYYTLIQVFCALARTNTLGELWFDKSGIARLLLSDIGMCLVADMRTGLLCLSKI